MCGPTPLQAFDAPEMNEDDGEDDEKDEGEDEISQKKQEQRIFR